MTKLIDSLCVAKTVVKRNKVRARRPVRVVDSAFPIDKAKLRKIKSYLRNNPDAGVQEAIDEAYYIVTGSDYDSDKSKYAIWLEDFDVMALGKMWPNEDQYESEILYIPDNGERLVSVPWTLTDGPESLMIIPYELAEAVGVDYEEVYPGFYYVDSIDSSTEDIGESVEDLKEWVDGLESYEDTDNYYKGITPEKAWEPITKLFGGSAKKPDEGSVDRKTDSVDDSEYRQFDRFNNLREEVSDKEIVDVLPSYMGGYEINKFVDKVRNFYGLDQNPDEEIEDSVSGKTPSFDDVRKILSDEEVVKELKDWLASDVYATISSVAGSKDAGSLLDAAKKVLSPDALESFVHDIDESHGISITGGSHFEGEERLNHLLKRAEDLKAEVDKLKADPNSDSDKLAAKTAMYRDALNEYERVKTGKKVSDAAYNSKFEKVRKILSDTTIVEELSHYMSSDQLDDFTETLTRNYDLDLEEDSDK